MFSLLVRSRFQNVLGRQVRSVNTGKTKVQTRSISIGPVVSEIGSSITPARHAPSLSPPVQVVNETPQHIILTGRASPSKRPTVPQLDAAGQLNAAIQALRQPGYQSTNREWLNVILELSKQKRYTEISSLWQLWMSTLPAQCTLNTLNVSEKQMFLPSESIFIMLLKCPAAVVTADEALSYLDSWQMQMTGKLHRMMVAREMNADDLPSACDWMSDLYKRNLCSSATTETTLFRRLFANPLYSDKLAELSCQAWDRSFGTEASLDAGWCAALLQSFVQQVDKTRCLQMAEKLINNQVGSHSFSAPELYAPLVEVLSGSHADVAQHLVHHWQATAPSLDMTAVVTSKQTVRSLLDNDQLDQCLDYCLSRSARGSLLRSSYALVMHILEKKERFADVDRLWNSWISSIPSLDAIRTMTPAERNCLLPLESDLAFMLCMNPPLMTPEEALAQLSKLNTLPSAILYNGILSHNVLKQDFEGVMKWYLKFIENDIKPNAQTITPLVTAIRALLSADHRPIHFHSVIASVWEHCMSSSDSLSCESIDVFLSSFERYEDVDRAIQVVQCILSPKVSDSTPKLVGSFVTRVNVLLLKKGRKPLPRTSLVRNA